MFNLLVGLLFSLSALGQPAFLKNGLVAYYPFNGNANDESGQNKNGAISGAGVIFTQDRFSASNNSLSINGNGFVSVSPTPFSVGGDFTVSVWARLDDFRGVNAIVSSGWDQANALNIFASTDYIYQVSAGFWTNGVAAVNKIALTSWNHLVFTKSGASMKLFINGLLEKSGTVIRIPYDNGSLWIGRHQRSGSEYSLRGGLDDLRFYNRALSNEEVKALYDYESSPVSPIIATQPQSQSFTVGNDATFCVTLKDAGTYNYQWQRNEQNINGATLNCYTINSVTAAMDGGRYRVIVSNSAGTIISDTATLSVVTPPPPTIATQPTPRIVQEGANVSLSVVATGQGTLVYQWQFNEQNLPGATSSTLNLNAVKLNTAGRYRVLVSSQYGVTISDTVTLTVNPNPPPTIVTQPLSRTPAEGTQVSLTVTATGIGTLTYQWQVNGQNIPGATSSTLVLSAVRPSVNGNYRVIVGNPYGTTISTEATVAVVVTDSDSDGLSDYEELLVGTNPNIADTDGDGLSDFAEVRTHKSNPLTTDTDGDGYSDGIEVARDGNPNNRSVTPTGALAVFPAVDVEFYTLNGVKYQLEVSSDMAAWTAQGGVVVGTGGNQNHLVRASKATQFWRLKVVP